MKGVADEIRDYVLKTAVQQVMKYLFSKLAFLSWGPFGGIAQYFVTKLVVIMIDKTILGVHILLIYADVNSDVKEVKELVKKINSLKGKNADELKGLDEELAKAQLDLIRFGFI